MADARNYRHLVCADVCVWNPTGARSHFPHLDSWPITVPFHNKYLVACATVYSEAKYFYSGSGNKIKKKALVIGEILSPEIPGGKYPPIGETRASFVMYMQRGLTKEIFDDLGAYTAEMYVTFKALPLVRQHWNQDDLFNAYPPTAEEIDHLTFNQSMSTMLFFAMNLRIDTRTLNIDFITHAYCALAKRGQVTDDFCSKISKSICAELGVNISIQPGVLTAAYQNYMQYAVNELSAQNILSRLNSLVPDTALRLKLTLTQAAGSGITLFILIGRAMNKYYDFPWGRVNTLTGGEVMSWESARVLIGDNMYYGFKRDLGAARSRFYKSVGYVAKELLVRIYGERTLTGYQGLSRIIKIKNKDSLDHLISAYISSSRFGINRGIDETEAERAILPAADVLAAIPMFN